MARLNILLAMAFCYLIFLSSVSAGLILARQGCTAGQTTQDASGGTLTCGGDGRYYDSNGQPVEQPGSSTTTSSSTSGGQCTAGQTTQDSTGATLTCGGDGQYYNSAGQPAQPGSPSSSTTSTSTNAGQCTAGQTTQDANGGTLTCGGDGQYYDSNGQPAQPGSSGGTPVVVQQGSGTSPTASSNTGTGASGSQSPAAAVVQQPGSGAPAGYSVGFSTQDHEPSGQQSGCSTSCPSNSIIHANDQIGPGGALAAAINPQMMGSGDICGACGLCFNLINAGIAAPDGPGGPATQGGAGQQIKVWIVNSCTDCKTDQFDINNAPTGWDNPQIYYQQTSC